LVDPLVALVEAFHLLQRIHAAACKQDDLPEPITIADFDGATVAARCWWGDPLRWAVTLFEGLLGAAACSPPPSSPPTSPFYTRAVVLCDEDISPSLTSLSHPHTEQACALLAFEWLRVAAAQPRVPSSEAATLLDWWRRVTATIGIGGVAARRTDATLIVEMTVADQTSSLDLMIPGARPQLARLLTGSLLDGASGALELAQMTSPGMRVSLRLEIEKAGRAESSHPPALVHEPRILLDAESGRSVVAYSAGDGVVCVTFHATRSVRVRNGGIVEPHLSWPRTIIGELPFGESGAVAWSNGLTDWRQPTPPHVMYRHAEDEEARSEELPFRPGLGTWWNGRVYWCCQPDGHGAPVGLASWAPGEQSRLEFDGLHLFDVQPFGDALLLHPRAVDASGVHRRQRTPQGWIWRPGIAPEPVTLGVSGSPTCRATNKDWDAYTYLEGDLVRIDSPFGTASMTCYAPHRVAWLGRSLVVNTFEWDVLLFDDVMTSVAHQGQPAFRSRGDSDADD
jgi:hypothetical protein